MHQFALARTGLLCISKRRSYPNYSSLSSYLRVDEEFTPGCCCFSGISRRLFLSTGSYDPWRAHVSLLFALECGYCRYMLLICVSGVVGDPWPTGIRIAFPRGCVVVMILYKDCAL